MSMQKKSGGNIHKIREFELEKVVLMDEFDVLQIVGEGWFGKILLVEHKATDTEMVLKALPKPYVSVNDFYREFHYGLHLSSHRNIVKAFDVAFETAGFYVFTQEYAPLGDLTSNVSDTGIGELHTKRVARQIASALEYMHSKEIVHRDVKLDNVLVFKSDFSRVKLCDFGESRRCGFSVQRRNEWLPYSPPEVIQLKTDESYIADSTHDVWQFGIVIFICLTGCLPWQKAELDDPRYNRYLTWFNSSFPIRRLPKLFKLVSAKACKMFRKFLDPRPLQRVKTLTELNKYLDDRWLGRNAEKEFLASEPDELSPSLYSFHSDADSKSKLLRSLSQYGVETNVNREDKKRRIRDWIQSSVITEEDNDEEEEADSADESIFNRAPIPGHISSLQTQQKSPTTKINSTVKDSSHKHIDPRTGVIQQGPSKMGAAFNESNSTISSLRYENESNDTHSNGNRAIVQRNGQPSNGLMLTTLPQVSINSSSHSDLLEKQRSIDSFSTNDSNSSSKTSPTSSTQNNKTNNTSNRTLNGLQSTLHSIATVLVPEAVNSPPKSPKYYKRSQTTPNPTKQNKNNYTGANKQNSTGYVNLLGEGSMKDTPYDRVKPKD